MNTDKLITILLTSAATIGVELLLLVLLVFGAGGVSVSKEGVRLIGSSDSGVNAGEITEEINGIEIGENDTVTTATTSTTEDLTTTTAKKSRKTTTKAGKTTTKAGKTTTKAGKTTGTKTTTTTNNSNDNDGEWLDGWF